MSGESKSAGKERTLSRIGRKPILVPTGVQVELGYCEATVKGPKGNLVQKLHPEVVVRLEENVLHVQRQSDRKFHRSIHGLTRTLLSNAIIGVTEGYQKSLDLMGVGYRAQQNGDNIILNVGYSHSVNVNTVTGVTIAVEANNKIHVTGCDKERVGEVAARIRKVRPPNAYKEKGIKYSDEILHLKPGKAATRKA